MAYYWESHTPYNQSAQYRTRFKQIPGDRSGMAVKTAPTGYQYLPGWGPVDGMMEGGPWFFRSYYDELEAIITIDLYEGSTRHVDACVGDFLHSLNEMDLYDDALIILTSGQDEDWAHGTTHEVTVHVPLIMRHADLPAGRTVRAFVQHTDLSPHHPRADKQRGVAGLQALRG